MTRRKTIQELMLLDKVPLWIIETWLTARAAQITPGSEDPIALRSRLLEKILQRRRDKQNAIVALILTLLVCLLWVWFPSSMANVNFKEPHLTPMHWQVIGYGVSLLCLAFYLVVYATRSFRHENRLEQSFLKDFYELINVIGDTQDPTRDQLWIQLVDESRSSFLQALRKRLQKFAMQHHQSLLRLAHAPTLHDINRVANTNRFDCSWGTLIAFGFTEEDLGQSPAAYFETAREVLRAKYPELFGQSTSPDYHDTGDGTTPINAGALSEGGG
ncbi:MAG: hypothetical protein RL150_4 [Candidatus Parcubacteria bacterium]|jgi:hypothetical protein